MKSNPKTFKTTVAQWSKDVTQTLSSFAKSHESRFSEFAQTFSHLGVLLVAFVIVVMIFMWKERIRGPSNDLYVASNTPAQRVNEVPTADVGIRMLLDQAQGEMDISSREALLGTKEASLDASTQSIQKLDLKGPWTCISNSSKGRAEIYVKNKQVRSIFSTESGLQHTLIINDCMYEWSDTKGVKQCGIGQYIDMMDSFIASGMFDLQTILESQLNESSEGVEAHSVLQSCKPISPADTMFTIPQGVAWSETQVDLSNDSSLMDIFGQL